MTDRAKVILTLASGAKTLGDEINGQEDVKEPVVLLCAAAAFAGRMIGMSDENLLKVFTATLPAGDVVMNYARENVPGFDDAGGDGE